ncbi:M56 family peptidase, partial [Streptomyces sp. JV176]|nr:M56 family peptidase [Streptomyces sp. JV176]
GGAGGPGGPGGASAGGTTPRVGGVVALVEPVPVGLLEVVWLVLSVWGSRLDMERGLVLLAVVGVPGPEYVATVVEHELPAVY